MKKIFLGLGLLLGAIVPATMLVSCGDSSVNEIPTLSSNTELKAFAKTQN